MRFPISGLAVVGVFACTAPGAHAATTVGTALAVGANGGEALEVNGDRRANDITISLLRARVNGRRSTNFKVVDRRGRVRVHKSGGQWGCRVRDRHTVVCANAPTSFAYVFLGAGDDRLKVRRPASKGPRPTNAPAPDGLAGIPQDEGSDGVFLGWRIEGGSGADRISGSPYFDHIVGGPGSDVLDGRGGGDRFDEGGEPGQDRIVGGSGRDTLVWTANAPLNIDLRAGRFTGGSVQSIEKVRGGAGDDTLIGSDGPELLQGAGGADVIAGLGGADLLVGDGVGLFPAAADSIDGGAGDDLIDISNKALNPFGPTIDRVPAGPLDRVSCGDGHDRIDALSSQVVASDCEGARFLGAATTVALRPTARPDGALVYDVPCPATKYFGRLVSACDGTLTLTRSADGIVLGSAPFSVKGGARADVAINPTAPIPRGALVGVEINGAFDGAQPSLDGQPGIDQFDFGWAIVF